MTRRSLITVVALWALVPAALASSATWSTYASTDSTCSGATSITPSVVTLDACAVFNTASSAKVSCSATNGVVVQVWSSSTSCPDTAPSYSGQRDLSGATCFPFRGSNGAIASYITIVGTDCSAASNSSSTGSAVVDSSTGGTPGAAGSTGQQGAASSLILSASSLIAAAFTALFAQRM